MIPFKLTIFYRWLLFVRTNILLSFVLTGIIMYSMYGFNKVNVSDEARLWFTYLFKANVFLVILYWFDLFFNTYQKEHFLTRYFFLWSRNIEPEEYWLAHKIKYKPRSEGVYK